MPKSAKDHKAATKKAEYDKIIARQKAEAAPCPFPEGITAYAGCPACGALRGEACQKVAT